MANQIKATPVLTGSDSVRFRECMANVKKISIEEAERIIKNYNKLAPKFLHTGEVVNPLTLKHFNF